VDHNITNCRATATGHAHGDHHTTKETTETFVELNEPQLWLPVDLFNS